MFPAIVIAAYNRPDSLGRLLYSISKAKYHDGDVTLVISIDKSSEAAVYELAEKFDWAHGDKEVIKHTDHLGLKEHILRCGDLTKRFGHVILLEDDLLVSPFFYRFSSDAIKSFDESENIAGISLYSYMIAENRFFPFYPHDDGYKNYFLQLPSSWGEVFSENVWIDFRKWLNECDPDAKANILPEYIQEWSVHSWKKKFTTYMIERNLFFVYPRVSYTTNFGDVGVNTDRKGLYQVPLAENYPEGPFSSLKQSKAVYDAWFEPLPNMLKDIVPDLATYDFSVDLHGTKKLGSIHTPYLLSTKAANNTLRTYGNDLADPVQNILFESKGDFFKLGDTSAFEEGKSEVAPYYVQIEPVKEVIFSSFFADKYKEIQDRFTFNQQFPRLFIGLVHDGDSLLLSKTIDSIGKQAYPGSQIELTVFANADMEVKFQGKEIDTSLVLFSDRTDFFKKLCTAINDSKAEYYVLLRSGDEFHSNAFEAVNNIFRRYPDISWLTGIETIRTKSGYNVFYGNMATRRWNRRIFERNLYENSARYIPPSATFWKRHVWNEARGYVHLVSEDRFYDEIWSAFFRVQKLYTCDVYLSSVPYDKTMKPVATGNFIRYTLIEKGWLDRLYEFLYINNFPYLRVYYKVKNNLPEVIRLEHETQWYFQSDF